MADLGVLPSRTKLELTSSTGDRAIIEAATARAAGCMTAEHASKLEQLWARAEGDSGAIVLHQPAPVDVVTRDQFRTAVEGLRRLALEHQAAPQPLLPVPDSLIERIERLELLAENFQAKQASLAEAVAGLSDFVEDLDKRMTASLQDIERNVPALDGIKMVRGAA